MPKVNFYLKLNKGETAKTRDKSTPVLIYLQFHYDGQKLTYSFNKLVAPRDWNKKKHRVRETGSIKAANDTTLNEFLDNLESALIDAYKTEGVNGIPSKEVLKARLDSWRNRNIVGKKSSEEKRQTFFELIDRFTSGEIRIKKTKVKKSNGTLNTYKTVKGRLEGFIKKTGYDLNFETINESFAEKFAAYLYDNGIEQSTVHKTFKILKVFLNRAVSEKLTTNTYFLSDEFGVPDRESESVALSRAEIHKLFTHKFANKTLDRVKDLFVFGCSTGLRISDYSTIQPHNIIDRPGGKRIELTTKKTNQRIILPCDANVEKIFRKYASNKNSLPASMSDQKFNEYIKLACKEAGLTEKGRMKGTPDEPLHDKPLYKFISSHTARRSFCTNLYLEGVKPATIRMISGHKTEASFFKYIKVSGEQAAQEVMEHNDKVNRKVKYMNKTA